MTFVTGTILGVFTGAPYAMLAVVVTLMYRSTGVLSLAHAGFASVAAYVYLDLAGPLGDAKWPVIPAAIVAVAVTVVVGMVVERLAIRPVRHAPATTKLIATLGVLTVINGVLLQIYGSDPKSARLIFPNESLQIGDVRVAYQQVAVLVIAVASALSISWFLRRARFGVAIRAVADDPDAARLAGVRPNAVSQFNWALGATLAGVTGVLVAPLQLVSVGTFPLLLTKALVGTLIGGLVSLPLAFAGGIAVGVVESVSVLRSSIPGASDLIILLLVVAVLVFRRNWPTVASTTEAAGHSAPRFTIPVRFRWVLVLAGLGAAAAVVIIPAGSTYWSFIGGRSLFFAIECLAIVLVSGWGGQVSLMQAAYAGVGAFGTAYLVVERGWSLGPALIVASIGGVLVGALVGIPALRLSGPQFAVASLAFASAASGWLFKREELPRSMPRGDLFGFELSSDTRVYFVMLAVTAVLLVLAWGVRRSTHGTLVLAARDAAPTVTHFGVSAPKVRMGVFMLSSFFSALGGGLYAVLITGLSPSDFSLLLSLSLVTYAVVGGMRSLIGPLIAAALFGVLPQVLQGRTGANASAVPDIVAGLVVVVLIATRPSGVASFLPSRLFPRRPPAAIEHRTGIVRSAPTPTQVRAFARHHPYNIGGQSASQH